MMIKDSILLVVSGPAGAGKGSICEEYMKRHAHTFLSISATTRDPRPGDVENMRYIFKSTQEFEEMIKNDGFLEHAIYNGNYYGTPKQPVFDALEGGRDVILEIDVQGAMKVRDMYPEAVFVFVAPPDRVTLRERLVGRGTEDAATVEKRMQRAIEEMDYAKKYNYIIINYSLETAVGELEAVVAAEKCRTPRKINYVKEVF